MRHTEFWARMEAALGAGYARHWASQTVIGELDGRTPVEALAAGVDAQGGLGGRVADPRAAAGRPVTTVAARPRRRSSGTPCGCWSPARRSALSA